jgi:zinc protease
MKANVNLIFDGKYKFSIENNLQLDALEILLETILLHRLREFEGGTYAVSVRASYVNNSSENYNVNVSFDCLPNIVDKMITAAMEEIDLIVRNGVSDSEMQNVRMIGHASMVKKMESPDSWMNYLIKQYENNGNPSEIVNKLWLWQKLTSDSLQKSTEKYIKKACFSRFVLMPDK